MTVEFTEAGGVYTGTSEGGRTWSITRSVTGWRLEFRDLGDERPTNAGNHSTLQAAQDEARR